MRSFLGYPALLWFGGFLLVPICIVFAVAFLTRGTYGGIEWVFSPVNLLRVFEPVYLKIFFSSLKLSMATSTICLLLAYPMAWAIAAATPSFRSWIMVVLAIPFLMNLIIRVYAIKLFTGIDGPLQWVLNFLNVNFDPFMLSQNQVLVLYGMVATYLPFMVFPLYSSLEKFDFSLVEAAQDLGAGQWRIFWQIIVPNTRVTALNGFTMVFVPCLGEFVIPDLLGGAKTMLAGNLITEQFLKSRHWPFGAALSMVLIILLFILPLVFKRIFLGSRRGSI